MRRYLWIYILISVLLLIWGIRACSDQPIVTQTARAVEFEKKFDASGYVIRNEIVYTTKSAGMSEAVYLNEERVAKGKKIATVYTDGIDPEIKQALDTVNAKIRRLEKKSIVNSNNKADLISVDDKIKASVASIVDMTLRGNYEELDLAQVELKTYVTATEGEEIVDPTQETLAQLYEEKAALEASVQSATQNVYSDMAGVFVAETDGYESTLTPDAALDMTVSAYEAISVRNEAFIPDKLDAGDRVCKIVDNTEWYFTSAVPETQVEKLKAGRKVWIRFPEVSSERYSAEIRHVSEPSNGKAVITLVCGDYIEGIYSMRSADAEIITNLYDGFELPATAVRVDASGQTGVFVNVSGIVRFRKVDILYQNETIVFVGKSEENGYIKLYDEVIVTGKNIYNGAIIK